MGGGVVGPTLAAAVSNAGGLGMLVPWRADLATVRQQIQETRALTSRPFGVNLNLEFPQEERLEASLDEGVRIISFFWRDPAALMPRAKAAGATVLHTVGSAADARRAADCGVDIIVAQGWEAGGHVRGKVATMPLIPAVVDAVVARSGRCRGWDCRRQGPRRGIGARGGRRVDRHPFSRKPGGSRPSALSRASVEGQ